MMKSGVYQIYNPVTNKRYIGSSIDVSRRLKEHRRNLIGGYHHNQQLQNAWDRYGDCLEFKPLEYCEPDKLLDLEQQYIDYYNSADRRFGYNIDAIADHNKPGFHLSEETKEKISAKHKGKKIPKDVVEKIRQAQIGKPKPAQSEAMKKRYQDGNSTFPRYYEVSKEKQEEWSMHSNEAGKRRYQDYSNRPKGYFLKVELSNEILYFPSLREASRNLGVNKGGIKYALQKKGGYMKKINCYISCITEEEFMQSEFYNTHFIRNKVSGEK